MLTFVLLIKVKTGMDLAGEVVVWYLKVCTKSLKVLHTRDSEILLVGIHGIQVNDVEIELQICPSHNCRGLVK